MDRYLNQRTVSMPHSNGTQVTVERVSTEVVTETAPERPTPA